MKKRILSVLMALCMVLSLAPTMAFAEESSTTVTYSIFDMEIPFYNVVDCQRDTGVTVGDTQRVSEFTYPYSNYYSTSGDEKQVNEIEAGVTSAPDDYYYRFSKNNDDNTKIDLTLYKKASEDKWLISEAGSVIAYGDNCFLYEAGRFGTFVSLIDKKYHFCGGTGCKTHSEGPEGCKTCGCGESFIVKSLEQDLGNIETEDTSELVSLYSIDVTTSGTFNEVQAGYTADEAGTVSVNVKNTGNQDTGNLSVALSGTNASRFTATPSPIPSIAVSEDKTFVVKPNTGLTADTYTATVTVSGDNGISASFDVSFTVTPAQLSGEVSINGAAKFGEELAANVSGSNNTGALSYQWMRGGDNITGATDDKYTLVEEDIGQEIKVVVTSSAQTGSITSDAVSVVKADGPAAPTGLNGVAPTTGSSSDGKITGTTDAMEYSANDSFSSATACAGTEVSDLASGTYYVRYKETDTHFAGDYATVVVPAYSAPTFGVTVTAEGNGTASASEDSAVEGAEITLTATPDSGYRFMGWTVVSDNVTIANNKFTMPASAVEVKAVFEVIPPTANIGDATSIFDVEIPFENVFDCWRSPETVTASSVGQTQYCYNFDYPYSAKTDQQVDAIIGSVSDYSDYYYKFTKNGNGTVTQTLCKYSDVTYEVVLADDGTVAAYGERCFLLYTDGNHYGTFVSFKDEDYHFHNTSACATSHGYGSDTCIPCGCGESFVIGAFNPSADDLENMGNIVTPDPTPSTSSSKKPTYPAKVEEKADLENGAISFSKDRVRAGRTVTITVTPDAGYVLDKLVILNDDGKAVSFKDNGNGTYTFTMPVGGVEVEPFFVAAAPEKEPVTLVLFIDQVAYMLDGEPLVNDVAPVIKAERTTLPIRLVAETLGAKVDWSEADQTVTITKGDMTIVIYIGQGFALVNGDPVELDCPAYIANSRTYLPVRFVSENLGAEVTWGGADGSVTIVVE